MDVLSSGHLQDSDSPAYIAVGGQFRPVRGKQDAHWGIHRERGQKSLIRAILLFAPNQIKLIYELTFPFLLSNQRILSRCSEFGLA
jgi:hypothetical protein